MTDQSQPPPLKDSSKDPNASVRSRRGHSKSRFGCLTCKRRKIKCDEAPGVCGPCAKSRIPCTYASQRTSKWAVPSSPDSGPSVSSSADPGHSHVAALSPGNLLDLRLLYNFTSSTYKAIALTPDLRQFYQTAAAETAFDHDYLMHGILALSAFDLARRSRAAGDASTAVQYTVAGFQHHTLMLSSSQRALASFSNEICHLILAFKSLLILSTLVQPYDEASERSLRDRLTRISDLAFISYGMHDVFVNLKSYSIIMDRAMAPFITIAIHAESFDDTEARAELEKLKGAIVQNSTPEIVQTVVPALENLSENLATTKSAEWYLPFIFLSTCHEDYIKLLRSHNQEALIIMAYWTVSIKPLENEWMIQGWPKFIAKTVHATVDESWKPWLRWPMARLGIMEDTLVAATSPASDQSISERLAIHTLI